MSKQFWAVLVVIVLVLVGVFIVTSNKSGNSTGSSSSQATNHIEGQGKSGVTLVEYGDYECPYCQEYFSTVKQVESQYDSQITFQFRNFPLTSIHPNAFAAARAAEAASLQGKFWQMHDLLYENNDPSGQSGWVPASDPTPYFDQFATQLGLNLAKFKTDMDSTTVNDRINADMAAGNKLGIQGTPTFFVDGKQTQIGNSVADFQKILDAAIKSKTAGTTDTTTSSGATSQSTGTSTSTSTSH